MKTVITLLLLALSLQAFDKPACYTAEIERKQFTQENVDEIGNTEYPLSCIRIKLQDAIVVRCGCYGTKEIYEENVAQFQNKYDNVQETLTYSYRFQNMKNFYKSKKEKPKKVGTDVCYTVEIQRVRDDYKGLESLSQEEFNNSCIQRPKKNSISVSCGCYDTKREVIENYRLLKKDYDFAHIEKILVSEYEKYEKIIGPEPDNDVSNIESSIAIVPEMVNIDMNLTTEEDREIVEAKEVSRKSKEMNTTIVTFEDATVTTIPLQEENKNTTTQFMNEPEEKDDNKSFFQTHVEVPYFNEEVKYDKNSTLLEQQAVESTREDNLEDDDTIGLFDEMDIIIFDDIKEQNETLDSQVENNEQ